MTGALPAREKHGGQPRHGSVLISTEGLHRATVANWPGAHVNLRRRGGAKQAGTDAPKTTAMTALKPLLVSFLIAILSFETRRVGRYVRRANSDLGIDAGRPLRSGRAHRILRATS